MKKSFRLVSVIFAVTLVFGAFAAPAFADEGKDESGQTEETKREEEQAREEARKAEEEQRREEEQAREEGDEAETETESESSSTQASDDDDDDRSTVERRSTVREEDDRQRSASQAGSTQSTQGNTEMDAGGKSVCPSGTAFKIDNLRGNGTFGPVTISNFTNTSFTWTSTQNVTVVLVKDGGGDKSNPGGTSGTATSFGQDISHVTFCLGGDVVQGEQVERPCDANPNMDGIQECKKEEVKPPCDAMPQVAGIQECKKPSVIVRPVRPSDQVQGIRFNKAPATAAAPPAVAAEGAALPFTGGQVVTFLVAALGLIAAGGSLLFRRR